MKDPWLASSTARPRIRTRGSICGVQPTRRGAGGPLENCSRPDSISLEPTVSHYRQRLILAAGNELVQVVHVGLMVLAVMVVEGRGGDVRAQRVLGEWQWRKLNHSGAPSPMLQV